MSKVVALRRAPAPQPAPTYTTIPQSVVSDLAALNADNSRVQVTFSGRFVTSTKCAEAVRLLLNIEANAKRARLALERAR